MRIIITENQFKQLINESMSDVVFHYTRLDGLISILQTNKINLSPSYGIGADQAVNYNKLFSLSLTTARNSATGFFGSGKNQEASQGRIRLEMNGRELNYNYKSKHVDYWQYPKTKDITQNSTSYDEMEERLLSDKNQISPANRYISAIEIHIDKSQYDRYHIVKQLAEKLNIPCYFYDNGKNFNYSIKAKAVELPETYQTTDRYNPNYTEEQLKSRTISNVYRLAAFVSYKNDVIKNKILQYAKENNFNVADLQNKIEEDIKNLKYEYLNNTIDYKMTELTYRIQNNIGEYRSTTDEFIRYVIKLIGYDMKKNNIKNIHQYTYYKANIGVRTQKQFNEILYKKSVQIINDQYNKQLIELNEISFYDHNMKYHEGDVINKYPEVKIQLDKIIEIIKNYYKNHILNNDDMFKYGSNLMYTEIMNDLKVKEFSYDFAKNEIDYDESRLSPNDVWNVVKYTIAYSVDLINKEIDSVKEEYQNQFKY